MHRCFSRSIKTAVGLAAACVLAAGCATEPTTERPIAASDVCKSGRTLVCRKHRGKIFRCSCQSKEALRDLLEPVPY